MQFPHRNPLGFSLTIIYQWFHSLLARPEGPRYRSVTINLFRLMTTKKIYLGFFAILAGLAGLQAQDDGINWLSDYREAIRQAKQTDRPIFLEFRCEA